VNRVHCEPNCGASWDTCDDACPEGYHASVVGCFAGCSTCYGVNGRTCALDIGDSFVACGTACPTGYRVSSSGCYAGCGTCYGANGVLCIR
jgi:hypothetical protein